MTCIAVVRGPDGVVWMGADSCVTRGYMQACVTDAEQKVLALGDGVWVGVSGSAHVIGALKFGFTVPQRRVSESVEAWVYTALAPALKDRLTEAGVYSTHVDDGNEGWECGTRSELAVVVEGRIFDVSPVCIPMAVSEPYFSIGSGGEVATGALKALLDRCGVDLTAEEMLETALSAAATHSEGVSGPFVFVRCSEEDAEDST